MADARGSAKLLLNRCKKTTLDDSDIERFIETIAIDGVELDDVFCVGIPAPDVVGGSLRVNPDVFDKLSNRIIDLRGLRANKWEVFIRGIPNPEWLQVELEVRRGY
jgi:hypothetical protein